MNKKIVILVGKVFVPVLLVFLLILYINSKSFYMGEYKLGHVKYKSLSKINTQVRDDLGCYILNTIGNEHSIYFGKDTKSFSKKLSKLLVNKAFKEDIGSVLKSKTVYMSEDKSKLENKKYHDKNVYSMDVAISPKVNAFKNILFLDGVIHEFKGGVFYVSVNNKSEIKLNGDNTSSLNYAYLYKSADSFRSLLSNFLYIK